MPKAVEDLALLQVDLGGGDDIDHGSVDGLENGVIAEDRAGTTERCFEVAEVPGRIEAVKRSFAKFVEVQVVTLLRIVVGCEQKDTRAGASLDDVIDDAAETFQFIDVVELGCGVNDVVVRVPVHAALCHFETDGVRDDRLLEGDFASVGKAGDHRRVLSPLFGKALLGRRVAIRIVQALDVAAKQRRQPDRFHEAMEVDLNAGLIAVRARQDHVGLFRILVQDRADRAVDFGIHENQMLLMLDGVERDL